MFFPHIFRLTPVHWVITIYYKVRWESTQLHTIQVAHYAEPRIENPRENEVDKESEVVDIVDICPRSRFLDSPHSVRCSLLIGSEPLYRFNNSPRDSIHASLCECRCAVECLPVINKCLIIVWIVIVSLISLRALTLCAGTEVNANKQLIVYAWSSIVVCKRSLRSRQVNREKKTEC